MKLEKTLFSTEELKAFANEAGITYNLSDIIDTMNVQGFFLKKGQHFYKFING